MTPHEAFEYEIAASDWWASLIGISWVQSLVARYFVWKVRRKLNALARVRARAERVQAWKVTKMKAALNNLLH